MNTGSLTCKYSTGGSRDTCPLQVPPSRTRDSAELQEQAQEQGSLRGSPDIIPQRPPIHVHVTGHTPVPSQLQQHHQQQRQQQQQQAQSMMPRVAHYQQSPNAMLHFQHYQPDLAQSQQQQGLALGIHQYQQHPDGLMHFQHQPNLPAMQQHQQQQMHGGGGVLGSSLAHQLQERGQYFDTAEHEAAASQPVMPMSYAQVGSCMQNHHAACRCVNVCVPDRSLGAFLGLLKVSC